VLIIPTYNEKFNIEPLIRRIRQAAADEPIYFVDDNSPDGTADEIRRMQALYCHIHLTVRAGKGGYASACRGAIKTVLEKNLADYIIQADADLSHPPEALPRMIELLRSNPVVIGSRYVPGGGTENWDFRRRCLSFGANRYARILTGVPVSDLTAGFVGYRADALRRIDLDSLLSEGYAFLMEMKFMLHRSGIRFCEFPIVFHERSKGKSKFSWKIIVEGIGFPISAAWRRILR
jgi:dolichol-phosphate mannosyltransferase